MARPPCWRAATPAAWPTAWAPRRASAPGGDTGSLADGVGTAARFGSAGRLALGPDGTLYLAEEAALRKITFADANHPTVTTLLQGTGGLKKVTAVKAK